MKLWFVLVLLILMGFFAAAIDINHGQAPTTGNRCPLSVGKYCP